MFGLLCHFFNAAIFAQPLPELHPEHLTAIKVQIIGNQLIIAKKGLTLQVAGVNIPPRCSSAAKSVIGAAW
tara:strand:+ start:3971 stop:4183 length:213 start_codon:yes stop_codon:yes gene_type:complete